MMFPNPFASLPETILSIDPGPTESAYVIADRDGVVGYAKIQNVRLVNLIWRHQDAAGGATACIIEKIASYGMPVGEEIFETVFWSGRFAQAAGIDSVYRIPRLKIKNHLCHSSRAKDSNVRQAVIDRFGGKAAIKKGGPLHGVSGDVWAALAIAIAWSDGVRC